MTYLVIYDSTGFIISQMSGDVREPVGIPFMWVEVPEGRQITGIDVTKSVHEAIMEDIPSSGLEVLATQVAEYNIDLDFRLSMLELGL